MSSIQSREDYTSFCPLKGGEKLFPFSESHLWITARAEMGQHVSLANDVHITHTGINTHTHAKTCDLKDTATDKYNTWQILIDQHGGAFISTSTFVKSLFLTTCINCCDQPQLRVFFSIQWCMPALRTDKPYTHLHTQTVESNTAQVVQNNLGSWPQHICILVLSTQWNRGLTLTASWQSQVSLDKRMHKTHMGRKGFPLWFSRPQQPVYRSALLRLAQWQLQMTPWMGEEKHNIEASEKVRATLGASQTSKKTLEWKLRRRATDEWILCSFIWRLLC